MIGNKMKSRLLLLLFLAQTIVILVSWLWSAAMPEAAIRSLLNESGIRWFFGTFQANLSCPLLLWIILLDIATGVAKESGMWSGIKSGMRNRRLSDAHLRSGLGAAFVVLVVEIAVILLLVLPRQATLLSVTGHLFPSSFSDSLVPIVAAVCITTSICYGLFSGVLHNYRDVFNCLLHGGQNLKTTLVFYVFAIELYYMVRYVIGL